MPRTAHKVGSKRAQRHAGKRRRESRRLLFEPLESRRVLSSASFPEIPGLQWGDADPDNLRGQIIYLDFDGATDVTYDGPVKIEGIDVPPFDAAPSGLSGQEPAIIATITDSLNWQFADSGVTFTTQLPPDCETYSTIYVGGDDAAFASFGAFFGLAESADEGNSQSRGAAFVFSDVIWSNVTDAATFVPAMTGVVAHEAGHLLGAVHDESTAADTVVAAVAYSQPVHRWISEEAFQLFVSQFGATSLSGTAADPTSTLGQFVQGADDEDAQDASRNPFGETEPALRHFWNHDSNFSRQFDDGIYLFDSAPNRAIRYMTGGYGLDGSLDGWDVGNAPDWQAVVGQGAEDLYSPAECNEAFYYMGHMAHLLQDMSVPAHAHGDEHLVYIPGEHDPFEDWVSGVEFCDGLLCFPQAAFDDSNPTRWENFAMVESPLLRSPVDMGVSFAPGSASGQVDAIYRLYLETAQFADNFDSKDVNGEAAKGAVRGAGAYSDFSRQELDTLARLLVPKAIVSTAELIRIFYAAVDGIGPQVEMIASDDGQSKPISQEANSPTMLTDRHLALVVNAVDEDSGIGKGLFVIESRPSNTNQAWTRHQASPVIAGNSYEFAIRLPADGDYEIRVTAENGGGRKTTETGYVRVTTADPTPQKPDLALRVLDAPATAIAGRDITLKAEVANVGTVGSAGYTLQFWLSKTNTYNAGATSLATFQRPGLAPQGSDSQTDFVVHLPDDATAGTHYIVAVVQPDLPTAEAVFTNQERSKPVNVEVANGDAFRFQFPTGTPGEGSYVTQPFGGTFGSWKGHLGTDFRGAQGTAVEAVADGVVTRVYNAGPGWGQVVIIRHPTRSWGLAEDYYSMSAHVIPSVSEGDSVYRGQTIAYVGPTAEGSTAPHLHFEIRTGADAGRLAGPGYRGSAFNGSQQPSVTRDGYRITWHDPVAFLNDHRFTAPPPEQQIDFDPEYVNAPPRGDIGSTVPVYVEIRNLWPTASGHYQVAFVLSADRYIEAGDRELKVVSRPSLSGNGIQRWTEQVLIPADVTPGTWYVGVIVDPDDLIAEINPDNNAQADSTPIVLQTSAATKPDLVGTDLQLNPDLRRYRWGDLLVLRYEVTNRGDAASGITTVRFVLTDNPQEPGFTHVLDSRSLAALAAGRTASGSLSVLLPGGPPASYSRGPLYVRMEVDPGDIVQNEESEANNSGQGYGIDWVRVLVNSTGALPDLVGIDLRFLSGDSTLQWGQRVDLKHRYANDGDAAAADFKAEVLLSSDRTFRTNTYSLRTLAPGTLLAGEENTLTIPVVLPTSAPSGLRDGPLYIGVVLNPDSRLDEITEANNRGVGPGKDYLAVTIVPPPPPAVNAEPVISSIVATPASPAPVLRGEKITLTASNVTDNNCVNEVVFVLDTNNNSEWDNTDRYLAHGSKDGTTFTASVRTDSGWPVGASNVLARATDNHGLVSGVATTQVTVQGLFSGPFPDDSYENNDSPETAFFLGGANQAYDIPNLALVENDPDYYVFDLEGGAREMRVQLDFVQEEYQGVGVPTGDLRLDVTSERWGNSWFSDYSRPGAGHEEIVLTAPEYASLSSGRYLVRVAGAFHFERNPDYRLRVDVTPIPGTPTIGAVTVLPDTVVLGETITFRAPAGSFPSEGDRGVSFFVDFNDDGVVVQEEEQGTDWGDGDGPGGEYQVTASTATWDLGSQRIVAWAHSSRTSPSLASYATVTVLPNTPPHVGSLSVPTTAIQGGALTLVAVDVGDSDPRGSIQRVSYYLDTDSNGVLDASDLHLGDGTAVGDDWSRAVPTDAWPLGEVRLFALATDNLSLDSESVTAVVTLQPSTNERPEIGSLTGPESVFKKDLLTLVAADVTEPNGDNLTLKFYHDTNGDRALSPGDAEVGTVTQDGDDYSADIDTSGFLQGEHRFFAEVVDDGVPVLSHRVWYDVLVIDESGPRIVAQEPAVSVGGSIDRVQVRFDEPIDPASFTIDDVSGFAGPSGSIAPLQVVPVEGSDSQRFEIRFSRQVTPGNYTLRIGPEIVDAAGNRMDQDGDGTGGEAESDRYELAFAVTAPSADFAWAFGIGGTGAEAPWSNTRAFATTVDTAGNTYVTGQFRYSVNFNPNPNGTPVVRTTDPYFMNTDVFVAKYDPSGGLVWVKTFAGTSSENPDGIAVGPSGNVYIVGHFSGTMTVGAQTLVKTTDVDAFLIELDANANVLRAQQMGGSGSDRFHGVTVDGNSNVYVVGRFAETASFGGVNRTAYGDWDIVVLKWKSGSVLWAKGFGSSGYDVGEDIAIGPDGDPVAVGVYNGTANFGGPTLVGGYGFAVKLNAADGSTRWAQQTVMRGMGVGVDASNNVTVTGPFDGSADFDPGPGTTILTSAGSNDGYLLQFDAQGNFLRANRFGGTGDDQPTSLTVDSRGQIYVVGEFTGTADFDPSDAALRDLTSKGGTDVFIAAFTPAQSLLWARRLGGTEYDRCYGVGVDAQGNVFFAGGFSGTADTDPGGTEEISLQATGYESMFVARLLDLTPKTLSVTNTSDSGPGSLRQAIQDANASASHDMIVFDISGTGPHTIALNSPLPTIVYPVIIDGTTEPDYAGTPVVELNGASAGTASGLVISGGQSTVRGLVINRFAEHGILLHTGGQNVVQGNYIGTSVTGTALAANGKSGVFISGASAGNIVGTNGDGDADAAEGNLISGNTDHGIVIEGAGSDENVVAGNRIGTNAAGNAALGGHHAGVKIAQGAKHNRIGTNGDGVADAAERNIIAGNLDEGVLIVDAGTDQNVVAGNFIGLSAAGDAALGNGYGVRIADGAQGNLVGTNGDQQGDAAERNVIAGNRNDGIRIASAGTDQNTVAGNLIGTNPAGTASVSNAGSGVVITGGARSNRAGTNADGIADLAEANLISGNAQEGLVMEGSGTSQNVAAGNLIGTDLSGTQALGNAGSGIAIREAAGENFIGGLVAAARNLISGNNADGVWISAATANSIRGNFLGTDASGSQAVGNGQNGILLENGADGNLIGGTGADAKNVISGNGLAGIRVSDSDANLIQGNYVGTDRLGVNDLGNAAGIVLLAGSSNNQVGSDALATGNRIAFNGSAGVTVLNGSGNALLGNAVFSNQSLGIDLGGDGVTANDPADSDAGPNGLQNFPDLERVTLLDGRGNVGGWLHSRPDTLYRIEFFSSLVPDPSGYGEGQTYLGFRTVTTDANGDARIQANFESAIASGQFVTATASDPEGNTSEFSGGLIASPPSLSLRVAPATIAEDGGMVVGVVTRHNADISGPLTVTLSCSDPSVADLSETVVIQADQSSATFSVNVLDDLLVDGTQTVTITATVPGYDTRTTALEVPDNDTLSVLALSPADNAVQVPLTVALSLTFNGNIQRGPAGNLVIRRSDDHSVVETIDTGSDAITISGATAEIALSVTLTEKTGYYVELAAGTFQDSAGNDFSNIGGAEAWNFTTVDLTTPTAQMVPVTPDPRNTPVAMVTVTFSENVDGVDVGDIKLRRNGNAVTLEGLSVQGSGAVRTIDVSSVTTADGDYTLTLTADGSGIHDTAGNPLGDDASVSWTMDTQTPTTQITFPVDGGVYNDGGWISPLAGLGTDAFGSGVEKVELSFQTLGNGLYWGGAAFDQAAEVFLTASGTGAWLFGFPAVNFPADGQYRVHARSTDKAGNFEAGPSVTFSIDTLSPRITVSIVDTVLSNADNVSSVTFEFTEPVTGFTLEDVAAVGGTMSGFGGSGASYSATFTASDGVEMIGSVSIAAGSYTDAAGNPGATGSDTVVIDTLNPAMPEITGITTDTGSSLIDGITSDTTLEVYGTGEALGQVQVFLNGISIGPAQAEASGNWTLDHRAHALAEGTYSLTAKITDAAGNESPASTVFLLTVDLSPPQVAVGFPVADRAYNASGWTDAITGTAIDGGPAGLQQVDVSVRRVADGRYWGGSAFDQASEFFVAASGTGAWSLSFPDSQLADGASYVVGVRATDLAGNTAAGSSVEFAYDTTLAVTALTRTYTGFVAEFNGALQVDELNQFDQGNLLGAADVTLVGASTGPVTGSVILAADLQSLTFLKTAGMLVPDTYTATLRSGPAAIRDAAGELLDGDGDGTAGGDYVGTFVVAPPPPNAITVSLPNITRGPGQPLNLPADNLTAGLPLTLSNGFGLSGLDLEFHYDTCLLEITEFLLNSAVAASGGMAQLTFPSPGIARLTIDTTGSLAAAPGLLTLGSFAAAVPENAAYAGQHVLDIRNLHVYDNGPCLLEVPSHDDDAVHVAAFLGDASGDRWYNSPDATLTRRIIGQLNTGLAVYPLTDPVLVVDITHNGIIQSNDTTGIRRAIGLIPVPNIPPLPSAPTGLMVAAAADWAIPFPRELAAAPGEAEQLNDGRVLTALDALQLVNPLDAHTGVVVELESAKDFAEDRSDAVRDELFDDLNSDMFSLENVLGDLADDIAVAWR